jgi:hypothetical protein
MLFTRAAPAAWAVRVAAAREDGFRERRVERQRARAQPRLVWRAHRARQTTRETPHWPVK